MKKRPLNGCLSSNAWRSFIVFKFTLVFLLALSFSSEVSVANDNQSQQNIEVRGTVTDTEGNPLVGVNIVIQGTTIGTITDIDGNYSLQIPDEDVVLQFSYVGHLTQVLAVGELRVIDVALEEDLAVLDEIVVIGYSARRQSELSSSVAVVTEEQLRTTTAGTDQLSVMLQGRVPGLIVSGTSGNPGSSASMVIRGRGSIGAGTSPLVVVDGIIGGTYNPADVASVTVLKDAAATGLYGSRAANGVIVITTRQGTPGEFRVSVNSTTGPTFDWDDRISVHDAASLYELHSTAMRNLYDDRVAEGHPDFVGVPFENFRDGIINPNVLNIDTDWHGLLTRPGYLNQHQISMSGGYDRTRFYVSGVYNRESGTQLDQYYQRADLRANVSHDVSNSVTAHLRLTGRYGQHPYWYAIGDRAPRNQAYSNMPYDRAYLEDGRPSPLMDIGTVPLWYHWRRENYLLERETSVDNQVSKSGTVNAEVDWQIADWARFNTNTRVSYSGRDRKILNSRDNRYGVTAGGYVEWEYDWGTGFITSNTFHTTHRMGNHNLYGILGQEYTYSDSHFTRARGHGLVAGMEALSSAGVANQVTGDVSESGFLSYFGQLDYNYRSRYFLVGSLRRDASSVFGAEHRWGTFYSVGANWLMSSEDFMTGINWLDILKLRASYGTTGNANIANYLAMGTYSFSWLTNYDGIPGAWPSRLPNPLLSWETAHTTNIGIEIGAFRRATLEIDLYNIINEDLLQAVPLSAASGFSSQTRNVGSMRNRGIDVNLNTTILEGRLTWVNNLNFNHNRNVVLELHDGADIITGQYIRREGLPFQYFYMREWAGVNPDNGDPQWYRWEREDGSIIHGRDNEEPAQIVVTNQYNDASIVPVGDAYPWLTGGFRNDFYYDNWSLHVNTNFSLGNTVYSSANVTAHDVGSNRFRITKWQEDDFIFWEQPGDDHATLARLVYGDPLNSRGASSQWLYDASYLRIQSVRLGYTFPQRVMGLSGLHVSAIVENLAIITNHPFGDADTSYESPAAGFTRYRPTRKFLFNIRFDI